MKTYKIVYTEELVGWFYIEANSEEEAANEFQYRCSNGQIDFSDMELVDSNIHVKQDE